MMNRIAATFTLSLLGACSLHQEPKLVASKVQPLELSLGLISSAPTCRVAADDGPVVADRGIGGTGAPQDGQAMQRVADRGIGGTGISANAIAETAIVGVVTGFASICVDGLEVQYDSAATVDLDGTSVPVSILRAGQMVVIQAQGTPASPRAQALSVRRAVVGRVDAIDPRSGLLTIAGQPVSVSPDTRGSRHSHVGDWIAVSGLRQADGTIIASRVDSAPATKFLVRGQVMRDGDIVRIGTRVVQGSVLAGVTSGQFVTASGHYTAGPLDVESVSADTLWFDPASFFGPSVNRIVLQAFVRVGDNIISFNGLHVPLSPNLRGQADPEGMAVVSLDRMVDGSLIAVGLHYMDYRGSVTGSERIAQNSWLQNLLAIWNGSVPGARGLMIRGMADQDGQANALPTVAVGTIGVPQPLLLSPVSEAMQPPALRVRALAEWSTGDWGRGNPSLATVQTVPMVPVVAVTPALWTGRTTSLGDQQATEDSGVLPSKFVALRDGRRGSAGH